MAKFMYDTYKALLAGGLADAMKEWLDLMRDLMKAMTNSSLIDTAISTFSMMSIALIILYFFVNLASSYKREMFSSDAIVFEFAKVLIACIFLVNLKEIIQGLMDIGDAFYTTVASKDFKDSLFSSISENNKITYFGETTFPEWADVQSDFEDEYNGVFKLVEHIGQFATMLVPWVIYMISKYVGYFFITSNTVHIVGYTIVSPLAIGQFFDGGGNSTGVKFIKKYLGAVLTMGVMLIVLYSVNYMSVYIINHKLVEELGTNAITMDNISDVVGGANAFLLAAINAIAVVGIGNSGKLVSVITGE